MGTKRKKSNMKKPLKSTKKALVIAGAIGLAGAAGVAIAKAIKFSNVYVKNKIIQDIESNEKSI